ncbi:hypothetical protein HYQ46_008876 [Verticillium longisporum]|nr:hypothetical protein HYQ46_008876 [Verticillium longisporum]
MSGFVGRTVSRGPSKYSSWRPEGTYSMSEAWTWALRKALVESISPGAASGLRVHSIRRRNVDRLDGEGRDFGDEDATERIGDGCVDTNEGEG